MPDDPVQPHSKSSSTCEILLLLVLLSFLTRNSYLSLRPSLAPQLTEERQTSIDILELKSTYVAIDEPHGDRWRVSQQRTVIYINYPDTRSVCDILGTSTSRPSAGVIQEAIEESPFSPLSDPTRLQQSLALLRLFPLPAIIGRLGGLRGQIRSLDQR
jgi:hypothetical protein